MNVGSSTTNKGFVEEVPPNSQLATARISELQFSILKASDVLKLSHLQIVNRDLYELSKREPQAYGSLDRRLGTSDKKKNCETCKKDLTDCVGHFGHINLELPIFHIGFFKEMVRILHTICKSCGYALISPAEREGFLRRIRRPDADRRQKFLVGKAITECAKKKRKCPFCGAHQGKVKKLSARYSLVHEFKHKDALEHREDWMREFDTAAADNKLLKEHLGKAQEDLTPLDILTLLRKVPDEDCDLLNLDRGETRAAAGAGGGATGLLIGGCRPEDLLYTCVPVPPVCIRPSVAMGTSGTNEDDLTMKIADILQINNTLKMIFQKGDNISGILENWDFLQSQTAMFVNSDLPGFPAHVKSQNMKAIRALSQRLKGKTGRFRGNLSGKRVDFSGRTVISPDPNLSVEQVGVPKRMAKILTYPERVTPHNIDRMRAAVLNGPTVHPGANSIERQNGTKVTLKFADRNYAANSLRYGDVVERHLRDDDVVLFNRQPSLHKMSIMCHRAKVLNWRTLRFNECVCTPYNADFDGDEMNLHLPQTEEARAEAGLLMAVRENLVTPRHGEPLVAATQDFLTTGYLITQKDVFYTRSQFCQIVSYFTGLNETLDIPPPTIFKPMRLWTGKQVINLLFRPNSSDPQWPLINCTVKARNYTKNEHMCPQDGWVIVQNSELIAGNLCKGSLGGAKQGLFYCIIRDHSAALAAAYMNRLARLSARWIGDQGFSIGVSDVTPSERLVERKRNLIRSGYDECDRIISQFNAGKLELEAGCSEEQSLEARMSKELSKLREEAGNHCLQELDRLHNSPLIMEQCGSKGSKINISQMVACVGQQVLSGKRIPYGFVNRTLPHFLKHSREPQARGFVENSFYSGLTATEFFMHTMGGREGLVDTAVKTAETGYMQRRLMKALEDLCVQYDGTVRTAERGIVQFLYGDDGLDPVMMINGSQPADFDRVWLHARAACAAPGESTLTSAQIVAAMGEAVKALKNDRSARFCDAMEAFVKGKIADLEHVRAALARSKTDAAQARYVVDATRRITKSQLQLFFDIVRTKYGRAVIEPGTAVGAIAAQSIGEPGTQMTLKTFHFAGVASMNITLGVPRIKEIINAAKKIATPIITAPLQVDSDEKVARIVKGRIEKTILGDIAEYIEEVFTPTQCYVHVKIDLEAIRALQLSINVEHIVTAILHAKQLKLKGGVKHKDAMLRIAPPEQSKELMLYSLQKLKALLPGVIVSGIPTVARAVINNFEDKNEKKTPKTRRYNLLVEGDDLLNVMGTLGVRGQDCTSNSIIEVQRVLGIEAARKTIEKEITGTMDAHGLTIDARHVALLADIMSFRGEILGITRFGVSKMKESVLMLASFEKTADHLFEAAVRGATDPVSGVSESIIMGVPIPVGTGLFSLLHQTNATPATAGMPPAASRDTKPTPDATPAPAPTPAPKDDKALDTADGAAPPAAGAGAGAPQRSSLLRPRRPLLVPQKQQLRR